MCVRIGELRQYIAFIKWFFFFLKQKTAYELGVRLVGSEIFIRDSLGVDLTCTEFDKWDGRISYSFPIELEETKAKTLKWLRKELKEYVQR